MILLLTFKMRIVQQSMDMRETTLWLWLSLVLTAHFGSACVPAQCLLCGNESLTASCPPCSSACINASVWLPDCEKVFTVDINSTGSTVGEGEDITLTCVHNIPILNLTFGWKKDGDLRGGQNRSQLVLSKVLTRNEGQYSCFVSSSCGNFFSPPHVVIVNSGGVIVLIICGVSALALVLIIGIILKCKMKRDNAQQKERMKQRQLEQQRAAPAPFTPRGI